MKRVIRAAVQTKTVTMMWCSRVKKTKHLVFRMTIRLRPSSSSRAMPCAELPKTPKESFKRQQMRDVNPLRKQSRRFPPSGNKLRLWAGTSQGKILRTGARVCEVANLIKTT